MPRGDHRERRRSNTSINAAGQLIFSLGLLLGLSRLRERVGVRVGWPAGHRR